MNDKIEKLIEYNRQYRLGTPIVSDTEYDAMVEAVKVELPDEYNKIKQLLNEGTGNISHGEYIIGSLEKIKAGEDDVLNSFINQNHTYVITSKCDGMSFVLHYLNGKLIDAITRGDGYKGISRFKKAIQINSIPKSIADKSYVIIRGEALIEYDQFELLKEEQNISYAHPRNAVVGIMNDKREDNNSSYVSFFAYQILKGNKQFDNYLDMLQGLHNFGFKTPKQTICKNWSTDSLMEIYNSHKEFENFPIDGLVIQDNKFEPFGKHYYPDDARAWKSNLLNAESEIIGYDWRLSKDGKLCPVAQLKPVILDGAEVKQASAFNYEYIKTRQLGIGAKVSIQKKGDIIPGIDTIISTSTNFQFPEVCPVCGAKLTIIGKHLCCTNPECSLQQTKSLAHMLRNIGVEVANVKSLENWNIHNIDDLINWIPDYKMKQHEKFNNELLNKLFTASYKKLICSMDWSGVGERIINKILDANSLESFIDKFIYDKDIVLNTTTGITESTFDRIWNAREVPAKSFKLIISDRRYCGNKDESGAAIDDNSLILNGQSFCFTGKLNYMGRTQAEAMVERLGGRIAGVSKTLTYLVTNDTSSGSSKNVKAAKLGVKVINELEFYKIVSYDIAKGKQETEFDKELSIDEL